MILVPGWITAEMYCAAVTQVTRRQPPAALGELRWGTLAEGRCVPTLHVGPYDEEAPTLVRMHEEVVPGSGLTLTGTHHEVYLSDPRRVPPARRTILRQPVVPAGSAAGQTRQLLALRAGRGTSVP